MEQDEEEKEKGSSDLTQCSKKKFYTATPMFVLA
jgi:hypothetical protein